MRNAWTKERIVAELQQLHAGGQSMTYAALRDSGHNALLSAAERVIGSMSRALRLAGIFHIGKFVWAPALLIAELRKLHRAGVPMSSEQLSTSGHAGLLAPARRFFGSWRGALAKAGVPRYQRGPWTDWPKICAALRALHRKGQKMTFDAMKQAGHSALSEAARVSAGSWNKALKKANIPVVEEHRSWNREQVLAELRTLHAKGQTLGSRFLVRKGHRKLIKAAVLYFGTWRAACDVAVPGREPRQTPWTAALVVQRIRARHRAGLSVRIADVQRDESKLYGAALRLGLQWRDACKQARVPMSALTPRPQPRTRQRWDEVTIIAHVRKAAEAKQPLLVKSFTTAFVQAVLRRYKSWATAMTAAGLKRKYERDHANARALGLHGDGVRRK